MKAVAVGDLLLPASVFDETIRSASWVTAYDSFDWDVTKKRDELRNVVRRMETGGSRAFLPTQEELERLKDAEVILSHLFTIPREVFEAAPKLRYILSARGGVENIDLKAAHEHGVSVIHCPAHNAIAVAEYAIGLMIAESRNIARADRGLRSGTWIEKYPDSAAIPELRGSNVGIIGFGTIGRLVAERLQVFGAKILVSDPFVPAEAVTAAGCEPVSKEELLRRSDFVTLHGRIGAGDPPIIGEQELREMMRNGARRAGRYGGAVYRAEGALDHGRGGRRVPDGAAAEGLQAAHARQYHADEPSRRRHDQFVHQGAGAAAAAVRRAADDRHDPLPDPVKQRKYLGNIYKICA